MEKEDKIIKVETIEKDMSVTLTNGNILPTKGKIINTYYESGRKDCQVIVDKPLSMVSDQKVI